MAPLTYEQIRAVERGELKLAPDGTVVKKQGIDEMRERLQDAVAKASEQAEAEAREALGEDRVSDLLSVGGQSTLPPLTLGGLALLQEIGSPFVLGGDITILDTALAVWLMGGPEAGARLLSAMSLERVACFMNGDAQERLLVRAAGLRAKLSEEALSSFEESELHKADVDTELLLRVQTAVADIEALTDVQSS